MERWVGRVAIVTGASAGIGAAIARALAEHGMRVVGVARRVDRVQALAVEIKGCKGELLAVESDGSEEEDVVRVIKWTRDQLGGVDVLVNNAEAAYNMSFEGFQASDARTMMDTNMFGLCLYTREVIKDLRDRDINDGHIINIGSMCGQNIIEYPGSYIYAGTKHAVRVMTEGMRRELRDLGTKIRVTEISPGLVQTEVASTTSKQQIEEILDVHPALQPRDIADALLYALAAPPHVQVHEIIIRPVGEKL